MEIVIRKQFVRWTWRITQLIKNQLADVTIELWDELEIEPVHSFIYLLEGEEYALWGTDDTYKGYSRTICNSYETTGRDRKTKRKIVLS